MFLLGQGGDCDPSFILKEYSRLFVEDKMIPEKSVVINEVEEYLDKSKNLNKSTLDAFLDDEREMFRVDVIGEGNQGFSDVMYEITYFKKTATRGEILNKLFKVWNTIIGSTAQVERVFSIAGNFFSVRRKRMNARTLDALVVLNHHMRENESI